MTWDSFRQRVRFLRGEALSNWPASVTDVFLQPIIGPEPSAFKENNNEYDGGQGANSCIGSCWGVHVWFTGTDPARNVRKSTLMHCAVPNLDSDAPIAGDDGNGNYAADIRYDNIDSQHRTSLGEYCEEYNAGDGKNSLSGVIRIPIAVARCVWFDRKSIIKPRFVSSNLSSYLHDTTIEQSLWQNANGMGSIWGLDLADDDTRNSGGIQALSQNKYPPNVIFLANKGRRWISGSTDTSSMQMTFSESAVVADNNVVCEDGQNCCSDDEDSATAVAETLRDNDWYYARGGENGRFVAFVRDSNAYVYDTISNRETKLTWAQHPAVQYGAVEYPMEEELGRSTGIFWSPCTITNAITNASGNDADRSNTSSINIHPQQPYSRTITKTEYILCSRVDERCVESIGLPDIPLDNKIAPDRDLIYNPSKLFDDDNSYHWSRGCLSKGDGENCTIPHSTEKDSLLPPSSEEAPLDQDKRSGTVPKLTDFQKYTRPGSSNAITDWVIIEIEHKKKINFVDGHEQDSEDCGVTRHCVRRLRPKYNLRRLFPWHEYIVRSGWLPCRSDTKRNKKLAAWFQLLDRAQRRTVIVHVPLECFEKQGFEGHMDVLELSSRLSDSLNYTNPRENDPKISVIYEETQNNSWINLFQTYQFLGQNQSESIIGNGNDSTLQFIWTTERTNGFSHLHLVTVHLNRPIIPSQTGSGSIDSLVKYPLVDIAPLTTGKWSVTDDSPLVVDELRKLVYFSARRPNPLTTNLFVVNYTNALFLHNTMPHPSRGISGSWGLMAPHRSLSSELSGLKLSTSSNYTSYNNSYSSLNPIMNSNTGSNLTATASEPHQLTIHGYTHTHFVFDSTNTYFYCQSSNLSTPVKHCIYTIKQGTEEFSEPASADPYPQHNNSVSDESSHIATYDDDDLVSDCMSFHTAICEPATPKAQLLAVLKGASIGSNNESQNDGFYGNADKIPVMRHRTSSSSSLSFERQSIDSLASDEYVIREYLTKPAGQRPGQARVIDQQFNLKRLTPAYVSQRVSRAVKSALPFCHTPTIIPLHLLHSTIFQPLSSSTGSKRKLGEKQRCSPSNPPPLPPRPRNHADALNGKKLQVSSWKATVRKITIPSDIQSALTISGVRGMPFNRFLGPIMLFPSGYRSASKGDENESTNSRQGKSKDNAKSSAASIGYFSQESMPWSLTDGTEAFIARETLLGTHGASSNCWPALSSGSDPVPKLFCFPVRIDKKGCNDTKKGASRGSDDEYELLFGHVYLPPDFKPGEQYPVVVNAYGGPQCQLVTNSYPYPRHRRIAMLTRMTPALAKPGVTPVFAPPADSSSFSGSSSDLSLINLLAPMGDSNCDTGQMHPSSFPSTAANPPHLHSRKASTGQLLQESSYTSGSPQAHLSVGLEQINDCSSSSEIFDSSNKNCLLNCTQDNAGRRRSNSMFGSQKYATSTTSNGGSSSATSSAITHTNPMVVVCVDGRGTPYRGLGFESAIRGNLGDIEVEDIVAALEYLDAYGLDALIPVSRIPPEWCRSAISTRFTDVPASGEKSQAILRPPIFAPPSIGQHQGRGECEECGLWDRIASEEGHTTVKFMKREKIAIHGWSYGGYITLRAIAAHPEWFMVAVAGAPVVQWDWYSAAYAERYLGTGKSLAERKAYLKSSLISIADKLPLNRDKVLVVHGWGDDNVHVAHTAALVQELKRIRRACDPLKLAVYANERHSLRLPSSNEHFETLLAYWLFHFL